MGTTRESSGGTIAIMEGGTLASHEGRRGLALVEEPGWRAEERERP
jgi:hypothetical protein